MARRTVPTYITNVHPPEGRTCLVCGRKIVNGQGAYVRMYGEGAAHLTAVGCAEAKR